MARPTNAGIESIKRSNYGLCKFLFRFWLNILKVEKAESLPGYVDMCRYAHYLVLSLAICSSPYQYIHVSS